MTFAFVRLSRLDFGAFRILGPGLGNLLIPWARAIVVAREHALVPIWPTWPQFKVGPILRGEVDGRFYSGLFVNPGDYVSGRDKLRLMLLGRSVDEKSFVTGKSGGKHSLRPEVVMFSGMDGLFRPLVGHRELIRDELLRITRSEHKVGMAHDFRGSITVHVRLGDFAQPNDTLLRAGQFNVRLPLEWILETIVALRRNLGTDTPVWLFSDGTDEELQALLSMPGVRRLGFGSAIADLLAMSCSSVLVPTSTFSLWAAFLGGMPAVYYPGQLRHSLHMPAKGLEAVREPAADLPTDFIDAVKKYDCWR